LENAGYDPATYAGSIGVWAGMSGATYYHENVLPRPDVVAQIGSLQATMGNGRDFLTTRVSYKLNLRGPSVNLYTAGSTSLAAVCNAFCALLRHECDMALAGGVSVTVPQRAGYLYEPGALLSPDGSCRPFDAQAAGTVPGDGLGVVVLKRLEDAQADGDFIYAVVRGAALNNDGADRANPHTPSVKGQAEVIAMAQAVAGIEPESISYVEADATASSVGDPIEVAALKHAFQAGTNTRQFCALGSVKGNIGHLDAAAGVAGLIKTVLALHHRQLPPSLHFTRPNPEIDFDSSPFYVNTSCRPWPEGPTPRRAGVSSFGIGGTNVHLVLEEAAREVGPAVSRREQLLVVSARTQQALDRATVRLARHLRADPQVELADVAYTLQVGRRALAFRRALVCGNAADAAETLDGKDPTRLLAGQRDRSDPKVAFLFPGQGAQYVGMAAELHVSEPEFASEFDACATVLEPLLGLDIRALVFAASNRDEAEQRLAETAITQPVLFAVELALARLWMSWGVEPVAMIGHSLGEYVAACLAGVLSRDQAAAVVATRGRLMQAQPRGAMMAVRLSAAELEPWLTPEIVVATFNAPALHVVAGPEPAVRELEGRLSQREIGCRLLATSHAFHSPMMDGALAPFRQALAAVGLQRPCRPWISCVTGDWVTPDQATDPEYWVQQLRQPVRFSAGVQRLSRDPTLSLVEVGPGHTLATLVRHHRDRPAQQLVVTSLGREPGGDVRLMLEALGRLWIAGVTPDWPALHHKERRRRVPLPTYSFERNRHWIDPTPHASAPGTDVSAEAAPDQRPSDVTAAHDPAAKVQERLRGLLADASGHAPEAIDASQSFLELGFDSLLLTQVSAAVQKTFGVRLSLRELLERYATLEALARHVHTTLDRDAASPPAPAQRAVVRAENAGADSRVPPVPGARLGRDAQGNPGWFVPDPNRPGKYLQVRTHDKPLSR
jgi:acyl transferase domain-containing protein